MRDGDKRRGTYTGQRPLLKGQEALLVVYPSTGRCLVDFDRPTDGTDGIAGHMQNMPLTDFKIEDATDAEA